MSIFSRWKKKKRAHASGYNPLYSASQWSLIWLKFKDHKLALVGFIVLALLYMTILFAPIVAPYGPWTDSEKIYAPPSRIRIVHEGKLHRPFVY